MTTIKELPQEVQDSFSIAAARARISPTQAASVVERGWIHATDGKGHNISSKLFSNFDDQVHAQTVRALMIA